MDGAAFQPGQAIILLGKTGHIRLFDDDLALIKFSDGSRVTYEPAQLRAAYIERKLTFIRPAQTPRLAVNITNAQSDLIFKREQYVRELDRYSAPCAKGVREQVIETVSHSISDLSPPSVATLSRWYKQWLEDGRDMALQVIYKNRVRRSPIEPEVLDLMLETIEREYKKRSKPSIRSAYRKFCVAYKELGYQDKCPDESTFRRRVKKLDRLSVIAAREGVSEARSETRVADQQIRLSYPLERVELDTAHFNIGLLNDDGLYVGKVSLYLVIDAYSRTILGFALHVGKAKETAGCVIHAIRHAISVKADPDYPMYGLFRQVVTDAGPGYRAETVRKFLEVVADEHDIAPTRMGWAKPFVERLISTMRKKFFERLDGYLGKYDPTKYTDSSLVSSAKYSVSQFREMLSHFIIHEYHKTPHSGLNGKTPLEVWNEGVLLVPPVAPADLDDLRKLRGLQQEHRLQKNLGITHKNQRFNSNELQMMFHRLHGNSKDKKVNVTVLSDPLDASAISVVDPDSGMQLDVLNVAQVRSGVSYAELDAGRVAMRTAEEAPCFETGKPIERQRGKKNRKGPVVDLDNDDPVDLMALVSQEPEDYIQVASNVVPRFDDRDEDEGDFDIV